MRTIVLFIISIIYFQVQAQENTIVNLYDAFGDESGEALTDWGFSALINYNGKLILFDGGSSSDILKNNSTALGIDLSKVEIAVLSHSHYDHISGLDYLLEINPSVKLFLPFDRSIGGRPVSDEQGEQFNKEHRRGYRFRDANVTYIKENHEIASGLVLIVTRSELMGWFSKYPPHEDEPLTIGLPELSLAFQNNKNKWNLMVGCSHSQVEKIVTQSMEHLGSKVNGLVGGFHLLPYSEEYISGLTNMLKADLEIKWVAPAHCTGDVAHEYLKSLYKDNYKYFGLGSKVNFQN